MFNFNNSFNITLFSGLSTILGFFVIFLKIKNNNISKFIVFCLGFSLSIMIGVSISELLPNSIINIFTYNTFFTSIALIIGVVFSTYFVFKVVLKIINNREGEKLYKIGVASLFTLLCHNIPEGAITYVSTESNLLLGIKLAIAISFHNIPEGIIISVPVYYATKSKVKAFLCVLTAALAEPIGAILSMLFFKNITYICVDISLLIVGVIMVIFAIDELYVKALTYNENRSLIRGISLGVIISIINIILHIII